MPQSTADLRILHLILTANETSAPYNEHCLPWAGRRDITVITYFPSDMVPPPAISLWMGDGSPNGFFRVLRETLSRQDYDVIHVHSPHLGLLFLLGTSFSRRFLVSTAVTVHDSYPNFKLRNRLMFLPVFARFQSVVCCSRASYQSFPPLYKLLAGNRLAHVQNGLDIARVDRIASRLPPRPTPPNRFNITAISRLVAIKNPQAVVDAFYQSIDQVRQNGRLVYIGDGPLRDDLASRSRELGLENRVDLTGLIPRENVFKHLLDTDLFISTSRGEGLPVAVLEAMACRCPVVLSDIPPHREIAAGVDFIPLIQPDHTTGFARAISHFREMAPAERRAIGQKCRSLVEERFSLSAMHAGYDAIYAALARRPNALTLTASQ